MNKKAFIVLILLSFTVTGSASIVFDSSDEVNFNITGTEEYSFDDTTLDVQGNNISNLDSIEAFFGACSSEDEYIHTINADGSVECATDETGDDAQNLSEVLEEGNVANQSINMSDNALENLGNLYSDDSSSSFFSGGATASQTVMGIDSDGTLQTQEILVGNTNIGFSSVNSSQIIDGEIGTDELATGSVTPDEIDDVNVVGEGLTGGDTGAIDVEADSGISVSGGGVALDANDLDNDGNINTDAVGDTELNNNELLNIQALDLTTALEAGNISIGDAIVDDSGEIALTQGCGGSQILEYDGSNWQCINTDGLDSETDLTGGDGISPSSITDGDTLSVDWVDANGLGSTGNLNPAQNLDLSSNDLEDGTTTIWDSGNAYIPNARLQDDSTTVDLGSGLGDGTETLTLGSTSNTIDVDWSDANDLGTGGDINDFSAANALDSNGNIDDFSDGADLETSGNLQSDTVGDSELDNTEMLNIQALDLTTALEAGNISYNQGLTADTNGNLEVDPDTGISVASSGVSVDWSDADDLDGTGNIDDFSQASVLDTSGNINDFSDFPDLDSNGEIDTDTVGTTELDTNDVDGRYVEVDGDTMTGNLTVEGIQGLTILEDSRFAELDLDFGTIENIAGIDTGVSDFVISSGDSATSHVIRIYDDVRGQNFVVFTEDDGASFESNVTTEENLNASGSFQLPVGEDAY